MGSLRARRPPPNLNLIVANPDSDEDSSEEERRTAQTTVHASNKVLQQHQQGQGVTITAQPPTPGISGMPNIQQGSTMMQQRPADGSSPASYTTSGSNDRARTSIDDSTGMQYRSNASPPPVGSSAYPPAPPVNRPGSSGSQGPSPSSQLNNNHPIAQSNWPVMMTASNVRPNRHPAVERSLPRIHTPPAYPIPLPPNSVATARPNDIPSGAPAPQQQQGQQQVYQAMAQKTMAGSIGGSPVNTSSPSSPSMAYAGSSVTLPLHAGHPGSNMAAETAHRRRHEGLPMLPPRPKQQATVGSTPQTSSVVAQNPQRLGSIRLAVTVDNENFSVVDVSGMASAEAIMERVFAKVSESLKDRH